MNPTRVRNKRQYDPPEYDDKALVKWLLIDQKRAENKALKEKRNGRKSNSRH